MKFVDINDVIKQHTLARFNTSLPVYIYGNSPFTRALKKRCEGFGFKVRENTQWGEDWRPGAAVVDTEAKKSVFDTFVKYRIPVNSDIDECSGDGPHVFSACAWGIMNILREAEALDGEHICIIGRGHAVNGLAEKLHKHTDATVTVCHSKTKDIITASLPARVIVYAAPEMDMWHKFMYKKLIIDVSGAVKCKYEKCEQYIGPEDIGRLTTTILAERAHFYNEAFGG